MFNSVMSHYVLFNLMGSNILLLTFGLVELSFVLHCTFGFVSLTYLLNPPKGQDVL